MARWIYAAFVILLGIFILVVSGILVMVGFDALVFSAASIIAPMVALSIGIMGISFFGRESFLKEDRFHTLNVWIAFGLIFFCLADITAILVYMNENSAQICFTIGLVQIPGLLLWALGIVGYLKSLNSSLKLTEGTQLWLALGVITTLTSLSLVVIFAILFPSRNLLSTIVSVPIIVVLGLILCIISGTLWIFRDGYLARPLLLLFFGVALLFMRSVIWQVEDYCSGSSFSQITAIESYLLVGASFLIASKLNIIFESSEGAMR
ncbi:MAG: hypothetical protein AM325_007945 [Candidatus Thorarchaeota archaeon SMTZ1-45]|nr:MAG: hypothetical protein AM325_09660 [Candidatus Thorarchaeota archaeon SMTZ1-45]